MANVYVTAYTRYGDARISITKRQWDNALKGVHAARDHIAIKVKSRLNGDGYKVYWLKWVEITFGPVSSQKEPESPAQAQPSPLALHKAEVAKIAEEAEAMVTAEELDEATRLFPGFFGSTPLSSRFDACGCVPRPITAM